MLFCPKCLTENLDESKYCRECGSKLEQPEVQKISPAAPEQNVPQVEAEVQPSANVDVAAGELLYQSFQLYESASYDLAMAKCKEALQLNPESTSGHSLLAMIHERKSDLAQQIGDVDSARENLTSAVRQYERVVKLNPDSSVDVQKLRDLKRKLNLQSDEPTSSESITLKKAAELSVEWIQSLPRPLIAGGGAALVVLLTLLVLFSHSNQPPQPRNAMQREQMPQQSASQVAQTPSAAQQNFTIPPPADAPAEPLFASPAPAPQPQAPVRSEPTPVQELPGAERQLPPAEIIPPVRLIPKKLPTLPAPVASVPQTAPKASPAPVQAAPPEKKWRGADLQMQGMSLARQGKTKEAVSTFKQAISSYQEQINAGEDTDSASAGIRTCKQYIETLESP